VTEPQQIYMPADEPLVVKAGHIFSPSVRPAIPAALNVKDREMVLFDRRDLVLPVKAAWVKHNCDALRFV
jgi:hypothetical protein